MLIWSFIVVVFLLKKNNNYTVVFLLICSNIIKFIIYERYNLNFLTITTHKLIFYLNSPKLSTIFFLILCTIINNNVRWVGILLCFILFYHLSFNLPHIYSLTKKYDLTNTSLGNGLVLIHPAFVLFLYAFIITSTYFFSRKFNLFKKFNYKDSIRFFLILSSLSLVLGSFWAQQELNWGGDEIGIL